MAGTITSTATILDRAQSLVNASSLELLVSWTADSSNGSVPTLAITAYPGWWITKVVTNPGSTAPAALYDITGIAVDGEDIFNSELLNRSDTVTERVIPTDAIQIGTNGFTLTIANNSVNSATGTIRMFLNR